MKSLSLIASTLLLSASIATADTMSIEPGWNLLGAGTSQIDIKETFKNKNVSIVWGYENIQKKWVATSPDATMTSAITDASIQNLESIPSHMGYWIKSNYSLPQEVGIVYLSDGSQTPEAAPQPEELSVSSSLWDNASLFTLDMIANKSFRFGGSSSSLINFDSNGLYSSTGCYQYSIELESGVLVSKGNSQAISTGVGGTVTEQEEKYKIIDGDLNTGYILSHITSYGGENISMMIFDNAIESPVDMSTKMPYTYYASWSITDSTEEARYDNNGTLTYKSTYSPTPYTNEFTIEDGKLVVSNFYDTGSFISQSKETKQIVFSIGEYDILKTVYSGTNTEYIYTGLNGESFDLAKNSVETFEEFFALSNNTLGGETYDLENGTFDSMHSSCGSTGAVNTFTILDNGTTLESCWEDSYCNTRKIKNNALISTYESDFYSVARRSID